MTTEQSMCFEKEGKPVLFFLTSVETILCHQIQRIGTQISVPRFCTGKDLENFCALDLCESKLKFLEQQQEVGLAVICLLALEDGGEKSSEEETLYKEFLSWIHQRPVDAFPCNSLLLCSLPISQGWYCMLRRKWSQDFRSGHAAQRSQIGKRNIKVILFLFEFSNGLLRNGLIKVGKINT